MRPGVYLLTRHDITTKWGRDSRWKNITLKEFVAPEASVDQTYVLHTPIVEATAGHECESRQSSPRRGTEEG